MKMGVREITQNEPKVPALTSRDRRQDGGLVKTAPITRNPSLVLMDFPWNGRQVTSGFIWGSAINCACYIFCPERLSEMTHNFSSLELSALRVRFVYTL